MIDKVGNELYKGVPLLDMIVVVQCNNLIDGGCDIGEWFCEELSFVVGPYSRLQYVG